MSTPVNERDYIEVPLEKAQAGDVVVSDGVVERVLDRDLRSMDPGAVTELSEIVENGGGSLMRRVPQWMLDARLLIVRPGNSTLDGGQCEYACRVRPSGSGWINFEGVPCEISPGDVLRPLEGGGFAWYTERMLR